jgi:hypothetical protein
MMANVRAEEGLPVALAEGIPPTHLQGDATMDEHAKPPFPKQKQSMPGKTDAMEPAPDHGEKSYRGSGRLAGKKAIITGRLGRHDRRDRRETDSLRVASRPNSLWRNAASVVLAERAVSVRARTKGSIERLD